MSISMVLFSSKAYNMPHLVATMKKCLTGRPMDPFLQLVDDRKLKAVNSEAIKCKNSYGSKEDNDYALSFLSELKLQDDLSKESITSEVVGSLKNLSNPESLIVRNQLLSEFVPDEKCLLSAKLFTDAAHRMNRKHTRTNSLFEEVSPLFTIDDDSVNQTTQSIALKMDVSNLLSVNQLLQSVNDTSNQLGRLSVPSSPNVPFKEMTSQCEALLTGKQQKMSQLLTSQNRDANWSSSITNHDIVKKSTADVHTDIGLIEAEKSVLRQHFAPSLNKPPLGPPAHCTTEVQVPSFSLPATSPYDNFLKAAAAKRLTTTSTSDGWNTC